MGSLRAFVDQFLALTDHPLYACSLPNKRGEKPGEKHVHTRDPEAIEAFALKWDKEGRGCFYCVNPIKEGSRRAKAGVAECVMLQADVDGKAIQGTLDDALAALLALPLVPSRIHKSGNGLHALWLLKAPAAAADVEPLLKKIRSVVGGDPMVTHSAALLRMPGTHNTKSGKWTAAEVIRDSGERFSLRKIARWLEDQEPVILGIGSDSNPFLDAANQEGFKPPIDVEARLSSMAHGSIHDTQLVVAASLLASGVPTGEAVSRIMEATRKVGDSSWDWAAEQRAVEGMCHDWLKKHPPEVVQLQARRQEKLAAVAQKPGKKKELHVVLGRGIIAAVRGRSEDLMYSEGQLWLYADGLWSAMDPQQEKDWAEREVEAGCLILNVTSTQRIVSETRAWLHRNPKLYVKSVPWDKHKKIATRSGLVDWRTGAVEPVQPIHYCTRRIECEHDPRAECPWWLRMLADVFPGEPDKIGLIQEILGIGLLEDKPRTLMRALVLVGPANTGKSSILNTMAKLFSDKTNTTAFDALENPHGLMPFLRPNPWVLHEAFDLFKWHFSATVKAILSGDEFQVNVKNGPVITHRFGMPIFWGTNTPPQFQEASRAMENRLVILQCKARFNPGELTGATAEASKWGYSTGAELVLAEEKSGLLSWALEGLRRAWKRGHLAQVKEAEEALHAMYLDSNVALGFIEDCVELDPNSMVFVPDFCGALAVSWQETHGDATKVPSSRSIGRAMQALGDDRIIVGGKDLRYHKKYCFIGLKLSDVGLDLWQAFSASRRAADRGDRLVGSAAEVNVPIPSEWDEKPALRAMRKAHKAKQ